MKQSLLLAAMLLTWATTASAITVDGTVDAEYGSALAIQDTPTGFGNNFSELNAAFALLDESGNLSLMLTGNLETNGNALVIFIDSRAGGAVAETVGAGFGRIGSVGGARTDDWGNDTDGSPGISPTPGGGSILDPTFNPDFSIEINASGGGPGYFTNVIDMTVPNEPDDERDIFIGANDLNAAATTGTYNRPDLDVSKGHGGTVTHAFNNTNTAGVTDSDASGALTATTGYEATFSSTFLANDGQPIRIMAFITNDNGGFLANQFLGENGLDGAGNLAGAEPGAPLFDAQIFPDNQFFTIPDDDDFDGDHNEDGIVDAADYVAWRKTDGGNQSGYDAFFENFGAASPGGGGSGAVPEPSSLLLVVIGSLIAVGIRRRK
jgi:hypothetical protein